MRFAALLLIASSLGACCTDPVDGSKYLCFGSMSIEEELELGRSYAPNIDAMYGGVYPDPAADQALGSLIREMARYSVYDPTFEWKFTILNTSVPNAFAVPGGYIYITRGLLAAMETEGQFISVMGHELGHVEHRHSHNQMGRQTLGAILVGDGAIGTAWATGNEKAGAAVGGVFAAGAGLTLLSFSRAQESESDRRGIYYAVTMGYDPREAIKTFEYFQRLEEESGGSQIAFLRTHPLNQKRIDDIQKIIETEYPEVLQKPPESFRPYDRGDRRFEEVVARIKMVQPVYERYDEAVAALSEAAEEGDQGAVASALHTLESCAGDIPNEALFHTAIGYARLQLGQRKKAESALRRAIELDDQYLPDRVLYQPHYFLGRSYLESDALGPARDELDRSARAYPYHAGSHYYLGVALEGLGDKDGARAEYETVIELDAEGSFGAQAQERLSRL